MGGGPDSIAREPIASGCAADFSGVQDCFTGEGFEVEAFDQKVLCAAHVHERSESALGFGEFEDVAIVAEVFAVDGGVVGGGV